MNNFRTYYIFLSFLQQKYDKISGLATSKKREMLSADLIEPHPKKFTSPNDYINYLRRPKLDYRKILSCVRSLRVALTNNSLDWIQNFGQVGTRNQEFWFSVMVCASQVQFEWLVLSAWGVDIGQWTCHTDISATFLPDWQWLWSNHQWRSQG